MARTIRSISARFLKKYEKDLPHYKEAARSAESLIQAILNNLTSAPIHVVSSRFKSVESLRLKLKKKKYRQPGKQLTDKIGVRVITYFENDIVPVVELLKRELEINEYKSEDKRSKLNLREFGYLSVHLIARAKGHWSKAVEFAPIRGMWFEIQVRSVLEHAWAEIEHEVVYKSGIMFSDETKRRFARLAGALEILEDEFISLRQEKSKVVDAHLAVFRKKTKLARDKLDSARMIAMLEVERPHGVGWRSTDHQPLFPSGIESTCAEALKAARIGSSSSLRHLLRSERVRAAEKSFSTLSLQAPTHLASILIVLALQSPVIFRDYFPDMVANPAMASILNSAAH